MDDTGLGVLALIIVPMMCFFTWRVCSDKMRERYSVEKEFYGVACQFLIVFELLKYEPPYVRNRHLLYATAVQKVLCQRNRDAPDNAGTELVSELFGNSKDLKVERAVREAIYRYLGGTRYKHGNLDPVHQVNLVFRYKNF